MGYGDINNRRHRTVDGSPVAEGRKASPLVWVTCVGLLMVFCVACYGILRFINYAIPSEGARPASDEREERMLSAVEVTKKDDCLDDIQKSTVFVCSGRGSGSGVLVESGGRQYVYTCDHVVRCADAVTVRNYKGAVLELGEFEVAKNRDMVRFELLTEGESCLKLGEAAEIKPGIEVTSYGDTQAANVVAISSGRILATGPDTIEVDCEVLQGNSGGPVVDVNGRVLALVARGTLDTSVHAKGTRYDKVRRLADRVDSVKWIKMDFSEFLRQTFIFEDVMVMLGELNRFVGLVASGGARTVVRTTADMNSYHECLDLSDYMEKMFSSWNDAVSAYKTLNELDAAYSELDFGDGSDMLKLQYYKIETLDYFRKHAQCSRDQDKSYKLSLVSYPREALLRSVTLVSECDGEICNSKALKKDLLSALSEDWLVRIGKVRPIVEQETANLERYITKRERDFEEDYKKLYDSVWDAKEKSRAFMELMARYERERRQKEEAKLKATKRLADEYEKARIEEERRRAAEERRARAVEKSNKLKEKLKPRVIYVPSR